MKMKIALSGRKKVEAQWQGFTIKTDQPTRRGGDETAPAPFDLFLASIGTCAGFFVQEFCNERGIPTEEIKLIMTLDRNPETKLFENMWIDVKLPATFPEKYTQAVKRAADQCAVTKHLRSPPEVKVKIFINGNLAVE